MTGRTVLIVEDDPTNGLLYADVLESEGFSIIQRGNPGELDSSLDDATLSAVITDIRMGNGGGLAVLAWVRSRSRFEGVPVIAVTGSSTAQERAELELAGFDSVLVKPVSIRLLAETVLRAVESSRGGGVG